jgi:hypothetical protein
MSIIDDDPKTLREEMDLENDKLWKKYMDEEMYSLDKSEAWYLLEFPTGRNLIVG